MNNKPLNREYKQFMARGGKQETFSDSEDESSKSVKSTRSNRSSLSGRSSSPVQDMMKTQRKNLESIFKGNQSINKNSLDEKREDKFSKIDHKSRFYENFSKNQSSRSSDRSGSSSSRHYEGKSLSPKSERNDGFDMMNTMKKPITSFSTKNFDNDNQIHKNRAGTPTKLDFGFQNSKISTTNSYVRSTNRQNLKMGENLEEEDEIFNSRSGRSTPRKIFDPRFGDSTIDKQNINIDSKSYSDLPINVLENDEFMNDKLKKHANNLDQLLNPKMDGENKRPAMNSTNELETQNNRKEKDPEVKETLEDKRFTESLKKEREKRRMSREALAKNQTETTKKLNEAIDEIENVMLDEQREDNLKEIEKKMIYATKPSLSEFLKTERASRPHDTSSSFYKENRTRTRSLSSSGLEHSINNKYLNVKPKTVTRPFLQSATCSNDLSNRFLDSSNYKADNLNDSASLRECVYYDWYQNKMKAAKEQMKEAKLKKKDDEERKAQELINKLEKSKIVFELWSREKSKELTIKKLEKNKSTKSNDEKKVDKVEKRKEGEDAMRTWLERKQEQLKEQKQREMEVLRKAERQKREKKMKKEEKQKQLDSFRSKPPPAPLTHQEWTEKKKKQMMEKIKQDFEKQRENELKKMEKEKKKEIAKKYYEEWLEKKENENLGKSRDLSSSMSSLPPFYPNSRTIPFGR